MKKPTCNCAPIGKWQYAYSDKNVFYRDAIVVGNFVYKNNIHGYEVVEAWMKLNYCPNCGKEYIEIPEQADDMHG